MCAHGQPPGPALLPRRGRPWDTIHVMKLSDSESGNETRVPVILFCTGSFVVGDVVWSIKIKS